MAYTKPTVVAENSTAGSYAADCPMRDHASPAACTACDHNY